MARIGRLKQEGGGGYYHCMSRVADGRRVFGVTEVGTAGAEACEKFRELMRKLAAFHGIGIKTWALMPTHFHLCVREPEKRVTEISDEELEAKVTALNGRRAGRELGWQLRHFREELKHPELAEELKGRYLARMGDVSVYMKELKGRFAQWYNRKHNRYGVFWAERFKSVLLEGDGEVLLKVAAYIDLNPVRAGLVKDPADYRYSGYGEAVSGNVKEAKEGLISVMGVSEEELGGSDWKGLWKRLGAEYRKLLYGVGVEEEKDGRVVRKGASLERVEEVQERERGELSVVELLRKRVRYFSAGLVIGSRGYVEEVFRRNREKFGLKRKDGARPLRGGNWGNLYSLRDLRKVPMG